MKQEDINSSEQCEIGRHKGLKILAIYGIHFDTGKEQR